MSSHRGDDTADERAFTRVTSPLSTAVTALLCLWLFGNLYEQLVWNPGLLADPRPGSVAGLFEAGSPVFYYLPWAPLMVVLTVVMRVRFHQTAPVRVRRYWNAALGCLAVSLAVKIGLITQVNPVFRDPNATREQVHDTAVLWAFANGFVIIAVTAAVFLLTWWRRP